MVNGHLAKAQRDRSSRQTAIRLRTRAARLTLAVGIANAAPYDVTLSDNVSVGRAQLKAGDYKVEMKGDKAVFTSGKKTVEVQATLEKSDQMFASTVLLSQHSKLQEIDLAGTQDRIVFNVAASR
jgi:hypothetical protein